jgi:dipeptidyl aminopeptidase/acylaminoacyl peptidase
MKFIRSCLFTLAGVSLGSAVCAAPPVSVFTSFPEIESLKISPSGKLLAVTKRSDEFESISVLRYPDMAVSAHKNFGVHVDIWDFQWVNDSRLLIEPAQRFLGYMAYKSRTGEIVGFDSDGKNVDMLFGYRANQKEQSGSIIKQREAVDAWAEVIRVLPDGNNVLIQTHSYGTKTNSSSLQRMNVRNGNLARLAGSPVRFSDFVADSKDQPLFVSGETNIGDVESYKFKPEDRTWKLVGSNPQVQGHIYPVADTSNPNEFIALDSVTTPTASVIVWNPDSGEKRVLFHSDASDVRVDGVDRGGKPWVYTYVDHYPEYWYPDPEHPLARAHRGLRASFKDANIWFTSFTDDMSLAVAEISAPRTPPTFYLMDVKNLKLLQKLPGRPNLKTEDLSPTDPFEVKVRDGVNIRGYLTTPKGAASKGLPMIVYVHGGPHGPYDHYDFDPEVQLLASRGYAVLQVNFRGSGGRGREFEFSGYGRWGREMQDDVTDSVKWAIASGIADRARICIYGGSYGGYAALTGAFREPEMFKCAVGMAGVYDLPLMFTRGDVQEYDAGERYLKDTLGTDMAELQRRSPVYNADKIKCAVMLIHGKDDRRVPFEHAKRMREALVKAGNPPLWLSETGEAHGVLNEDHRVEMYEQMLAFFEKNIGTPGAAPAAK